jgi:hypothetical protein
MPLPADVGDAFSAYLCHARPAIGEPPGVSAAVPVRPSPLATDPRIVVGTGTGVCPGLATGRYSSRVALDKVVFRPCGAHCWGWRF